MRGERGEGLGWGRLQLSFADVFQGGGNGSHVQLNGPSPALHMPDFLTHLVEGFHHPDPLACLLGKLGDLGLSIDLAQCLA